MGLTHLPMRQYDEQCLPFFIPFFSFFRTCKPRRSVLVVGCCKHIHMSYTSFSCEHNIRLIITRSNWSFQSTHTFSSSTTLTSLFVSSCLDCRFVFRISKLTLIYTKCDKEFSESKSKRIINYLFEKRTPGFMYKVHCALCTVTSIRHEYSHTEYYMKENERRNIVCEMAIAARCHDGINGWSSQSGYALMS